MIDFLHKFFFVFSYVFFFHMTLDTQVTYSLIDEEYIFVSSSFFF